MLAISQTRTRLYLLSLFFLSAAAPTAFAQDDVRTSVSTQYTKAERDAGVVGRLSRDEHAALATEGSRSAGKQSSLQSPVQKDAGTSRNYATANGDFWFYSADVLLFNDHDVDGHFHGIDLLFDADTYYSEVDVYAVVYLSLDGGPWNEYSATDNFTLFASTSDDEFNIVTELVSGYPTGSYDLLIELFDAYNDDFLASFGPVDTSELVFLPLEDANRDAPYIPPPTTVVVHDGGGSLGWLSLFGLLLAARAAVRRSPES